jgi:hypothetical protein
MNVINKPLELARQVLSSSSQSDAEEEQRVLQLFRNRAELKKAYTELQDEIHRLKDRLKQQEGATARVQEMLESLEARLGTNDTAYPTLVFYQLRRLWSTGTDVLRAFGADLETQHVERERRAFIAEVNRREFARRQESEGRLRDAEGHSAEAVQHAARMARELAALNRPWHYFRRKDLRARLVIARQAQAQAEQLLAAARSDYEQVMATAEEAFPGLSVEARRSANLAVMAYAEVLCVRLAATPLVALARAAVQRREAADEYGGRAECEALMGNIARARDALQQRGSIGQDLRARVERLQRVARYRADADTIPVPESIDSHEPGQGGAAARHAPAGREPQGAAAVAVLPNVVSEDTWDLFKVLLR